MCLPACLLCLDAGLAWLAGLAGLLLLLPPPVPVPFPPPFPDSGQAFSGVAAAGGELKRGKGGKRDCTIRPLIINVARCRPLAARPSVGLLASCGII